MEPRDQEPRGSFDSGNIPPDESPMTEGRPLRSWQKVALTIVIAGAAFGTLAFVGILAILPDPSELGRSLQPTNWPPATAIATPAPVAVVATPTLPPVKAPLSTKTAPVVAVQGVGVPAPAAAAVDDRARRELVSQKFVERYLSDDRMQARVCDSLQASPIPFTNVQEFGRQIEASLLGEATPSATAEAVMLPIEYTLKNEAVRELVASARNAANRGNTGFVEKAQFYAQAARATASLYNSRQELEAVSERAYALYALGRAAALKPEVLQDADLGDLCRGLESSAVSGTERDATFDRERLARLLQRHGIESDAIGYDPQMSTQIRVDTSSSTLQIRAPWLEKVLKTSQ